MPEMRLRLVAEGTRKGTGDLPESKVSASRLADATGESPSEQWRPVPDFPGYEVSNLGRVRLTKIIKTYPDSNGYLNVELWNAKDKYHRGNHGTRKKLHVLVARAFIPNPKHLPQVNHIDRDRTNSNVDNLEWVTPKGNSEHSWSFPDRAKTVPRGEKHKLSKFTRHQVLCIRALAGIWRQRSMARKFGVTQHAISCIVKRATWKHV